MASPACDWNFLWLAAAADAHQRVAMEEASLFEVDDDDAPAPHADAALVRDERQPNGGGDDGEAVGAYGESDDVRVTWETVPNAAFDEVVARIIMDPLYELDVLPNVFIRREADGSTLLHVIAGWANCHELVERLLLRGIPPDATDNSGWTPLLEAAQEGQVQICEVLLAHSATPDLALGDVTPLRAAAEVGNEEMTKWLLEQPGTWPGVWDKDFFQFLLSKTPGAVPTYLDRFATVLNHSKRGYIGVRYSQLRYLYGEPHVPVEDTALGLVVQSSNARDILSHRVMKYLLKAKWKSFARAKFRREFSAYVLLLVSYYVPTIWADPDWIQFATTFDYWVGFSRFLSWICCMYLLVRVELHEFLGDSARNYFMSFWNWLNIITYVATMLSIPIEFQGASLQDVRNSVLALITVSLWINLLQFLQVSTESGLLIAMMSHMAKDVYRFLLLYAVFICGFSGAFYILLRGQTGYEDFTNSFVTVFLMLFGAIDYSVFSDKSLKGWLWYMGNFLLFMHLVGVVIVLLNILIAMMATTYSDVWDATEAEALKSHAMAIVRMEKSLRKKERTAKYLALLQPPKSKTPKAPSVKGTKTSAASNQDVLTSRSTAKRAITESVLSKLKGLPLAAEAETVVNRALSKGANIIAPSFKSNRSAIHPDVVDVNSVREEKPPLEHPGTAGAAAAAAGFIGHLIEAPNLNVLEQTLFLKSAFDQDDDRATSATMGKTLAILEDGIRYELPTKKAKEDEHLAAMHDLQVRVEQLTRVVLELQEQHVQGRIMASSSSSLKRKSTFIAGGVGSAYTRRRPSSLAMNQTSDVKVVRATLTAIH